MNNPVHVAVPQSAAEANLSDDAFPPVVVTYEHINNGERRCEARLLDVARAIAAADDGPAGVMAAIHEMLGAADHRAVLAVTGALGRALASLAPGQRSARSHDCEVASRG